MFDDPASFRLDRDSNRHMSFGFGIHNCPGANLARMEMRVVLEELLASFPDMRIDGEAPAYRFGGGDYSFLPELRVAWGA